MASDMTFDLDAEIDTLYRLQLNDFTSARDELSKRIRQSGDRELAGRVKALVKPAVSAWAVNQVFWNHRKTFDRLLESGRRVREAQAEGAAALREASGSRREAERECLRLAERALREAGHAAGPTILKRVATSFDALAAYGRLQPDPPPGRLVGDVAPPGFEALEGLTVASAPKAGKPETKPARLKASAKPPADAEPPNLALHLTRARADLKSAREGAATAEAACDRARTTAEQQVRVLLAAQQRWADAVAQLHEADLHARDAARFREQAVDRLAAARSAMAELEGQLP